MAALAVNALVTPWLARLEGVPCKGCYCPAWVPVRAVQAASPIDAVITMGWGDVYPIYPGKRDLDWSVPIQLWSRAQLAHSTTTGTAPMPAAELAPAILLWFLGEEGRVAPP